MYKVCCTRFTNRTWEQNNLWKEKQTYSGCIYNSPTKIKESIPLQCVVFMIEMNNELNIIMGIGMIKNYIHTDKYYKIYEDGNYNRYTYKSLFRIDRAEFKEREKYYIEKLENLIFRGKTHIKRSHGITEIPAWMFEKIPINYIDILKNMFIQKYFRENQNQYQNHIEYDFDI